MDRPKCVEGKDLLMIQNLSSAVTQGGRTKTGTASELCCYCKHRCDVREWGPRFQSIVSLSSFDLKPKCLQCIAKTKELALLL